MAGGMNSKICSPLLSLALGVLIVTGPQSQAQDVDTQGISELEYGELFVSQAKSETPHPWQLGAGYSYGFSNPYLGIHGFHGQLAYQWGRFVQTGVSATFFASQETSLATRLQSELAVQDI